MTLRRAAATARSDICFRGNNQKPDLQRPDMFSNCHTFNKTYDVVTLSLPLFIFKTHALPEKRIFMDYSRQGSKSGYVFFSISRGHKETLIAQSTLGPSI